MLIGQQPFGEIVDRILFRDDDLVVLDKPSGISLFADRSGNPCLWDLLHDFYRSENLGPPRQVHRLDKGTSGVLLVALSERAQRALTRQFTRREVSKTYIAVTRAVPVPPRAVIDLPLCPGRKGRFRVAGPRAEIELVKGPSLPVWRLRPGAPVPAGRSPHPSRTQYRALGTVSRGNLVLLRPATGRTHQLRVHLAWLSWPIVGDPLYEKHPPKTVRMAALPELPIKTTETSRPESPLRLLLHCHKIAVWDTWTAPHRYRRLVFRAPLPAAFLE